MIRKLFFRKLRWENGEELRPWVCAAILTVGSVTALSGSTFGIMKWATYTAHNNCSKFENSTQLETDFVQYGFWKWECMVTLPNGEILPDHRVIGIVDDSTG